VKWYVRLDERSSVWRRLTAWRCAARPAKVSIARKPETGAGRVGSIELLGRRVRYLFHSRGGLVHS